MRKAKIFTILIIGLALLTGCVKKHACSPVVPGDCAEPVAVVTGLESGTAAYVWEEPIVDVIDVPPGLDPDGIYYRPAHKEVIEIRQGRWQHYKGAESQEK